MLGLEPMIPDLSGLLTHFGAEVVLCLGIPLVIVADLLVKPSARERVAGSLAFVVMLVAFFLAVTQDASASGVVSKMLRADGLAKAFRVIATGTGVIAAWSARRGGDLKGGCRTDARAAWGSATCVAWPQR